MKCFKCNKPAVWSLASGDIDACDECVPRGCSCNEEPIDGNFENEDPQNWAEPTDEKGRKYPCCEWFYVNSELVGEV